MIPLLSTLLGVGGTTAARTAAGAGVRAVAGAATRAVAGEAAEAAATRAVPGFGRWAGDIWNSHIAGAMPKTAGELAFSVVPDLGFAAMTAAMMPGADRGIGYSGSSVADRALAGGFDFGVNTLSGLSGRVLGHNLGRGRPGITGLAEMGAQMALPMLLRNPIMEKEFARQQEAAQRVGLQQQEEVIRQEVARRTQGAGGGGLGEVAPSPPAAPGLRQLGGSGLTELGVPDPSQYAANTLRPFTRDLYDADKPLRDALHTLNMSALGLPG